MTLNDGYAIELSHKTTVSLPLLVSLSCWIVDRDWSEKDRVRAFRDVWLANGILGGGAVRRSGVYQPNQCSVAMKSEGKVSKDQPLRR